MGLDYVLDRQVILFRSCKWLTYGDKLPYHEVVLHSTGGYEKGTKSD